MPNKIKVILILVAIVALFSVYKLGQYIDTVANGNSTYQVSSPLPNPDNDLDSDGLDNQQEMIWGTDPFNPDTDGDGFKDGEEVKSGHNPLVPGPDDLINAENLTLQFSELAVGGLYSGDLKPDSENYAQALADITSTVADSGKYTFSREEPLVDLNIIDNGPKNYLEYLKNLNPILNQFEVLLKEQYENLIQNLNTIGEKGFGVTSIKNFYSQQALAQSDLFQQMMKMPVPKDFKNAHEYFLGTIQQIESISTTISNGESDPVKASMALGTLGDTYQDYETLLSKYRDVMKLKGLENIYKQ